MIHIKDRDEVFIIPTIKYKPTPFNTSWKYIISFIWLNHKIAFPIKR